MIFGGKDKDDKQVTELQNRIAQLEQELSIYREALEFYAKPDSWKQGHKYRDADEATIFTDSSATAAAADQGGIAHRALQKAKNL